MMSKKTYIFVAIILIAYFVVSQWYILSTRSFWEDETYTAKVSELAIADILKISEVENHPPLNYLLFGLWGRIFGFSEIGLRSLSFIFLSLCVLVLFLYYEYTVKEKSGLLAVCMFVFSPFVLTYGSNARYYALSALLLISLLLVFREVVKRNKLYFLPIVVLLETALIYTVYLGLFVIVIINLWSIFLFFRKQIQLKSLIGWIIAQFFVIVLYLPIIFTFLNTARQGIQTSVNFDHIFSGILVRGAYSAYAFGVGEFLNPLSFVGVSGVAIYCLLLILSLRKVSYESAVEYGLYFGIIFVSIGINLIAKPPNNTIQNIANRMFLIYPISAILLARGLVSVEGLARKFLLSIYLIVLLIGNINNFSGRQAVKPILVVPWKEMMEIIRTSEYRGVICSGGDTACGYYVNRYGYDLLSPSTTYEMVLPEGLWWIQTNIGEPRASQETEEKQLQMLNDYYQYVNVYSYAPQDKNIQDLKERYFGNIGYDYREEMYYFWGRLR